MLYRIHIRCFDNINTFYENVSNKYFNTYSYELMCKNIDNAINGMYQIENGLIRREPTISRWQNQGCYMANTKKWYYLYKIVDDEESGEQIVLVIDACHSQNMHESQAQRLEKLNHLQVYNLLCECYRKLEHKWKKGA